NGGPTNWSSSFGERPHIDLLVAYDPSPRGATFALDDNVGKAIVYQNSSPMMFGLGGGTISGPQVEVVEIAQNHLLVQTNTKLHDRTVEEVRKLTEAPNDSSIERDRGVSVPFPRPRPQASPPWPVRPRVASHGDSYF